MPSWSQRQVYKTSLISGYVLVELLCVCIISIWYIYISLNLVEGAICNIICCLIPTKNPSFTRRYIRVKWITWHHLYVPLPFCPIYLTPVKEGPNYSNAAVLINVSWQLAAEVELICGDALLARPHLTYASGWEKSHYNCRQWGWNDGAVLNESRHHRIFQCGEFRQ